MMNFDGIRRLPTIFCLALSLSFSLGTRSSAADMEVRVESGTISTNDIYKDFRIWLDNGTGSNVSFATFSLKLILEPVGANALSFATDANQANLYTTPADYSVYVFNGNSANKDTLDGDPSAYPWVISTSVSTDDEYSVSDITADTQDMTIPDGTSRLLAVVRVLPGSAQQADLFGLNIVTGGETVFSMADFSEVPFTTTNGLITVVPEPSTYALGLTSSLLVGLIARRRKTASQA